MKKNHNKYYDEESLTPFAFPAIFVSCMIVASFFLLSGGQNSNATKDSPHNIKVVQVAVNDNKSIAPDSKNTNDNKENSSSHVSDSDTGENKENSLESKDSTEDSNESLNNNSFDSDKKNEEKNEVSTENDSKGVNESNERNEKEKKDKDSKSSNEAKESDDQSNSSKYQSEMVKRLEADPNAHMNKDGNWYVIVKPGDTLTSISRKYGYSVDQLAQFNKIQNVNLIYANSSIVLPNNK